jgi:hypothetical protein
MDVHTCAYNSILVFSKLTDKGPSVIRRKRECAYTQTGDVRCTFRSSEGTFDEKNVVADLSVCVHARMSVCLYMNGMSPVRVCVMCMCVCVCMYVYIHIHIIYVYIYAHTYHRHQESIYLNTQSSRTPLRTTLHTAGVVDCSCSHNNQAGLSANMDGNCVTVSADGAEITVQLFLVFVTVLL